MSVEPPARKRGLTEAQVRRWLGMLRRPDQLARPELADLLRAHGRLPASPTPVAAGRAAAELLVEAIERLRPPGEASREQQLPYLVLKTCFIDGAKSHQAAGRFGMSERQLSRERSRAIGLLRAELEVPFAEPERSYRPEPIPAILGFLERPSCARELRETLERHHFAHVHGPPGVGKTSLVAELATEAGAQGRVFWYRFRPGVNDSLGAVLFELGEYLRNAGRKALSTYLSQALPAVDVGVATRLLLQDLDGAAHLFAVDDFQVVERERSIAGLLEEMVSRLPDLRVITISRHREEGRGVGAPYAVPPLSRSETRALLAQFNVEVTPQVADTIHSWTHGIPHLIKLAASWLKTATPEEVGHGTGALADLSEVQAFLLDSITELIDPDDRAVLEAASVFRDRFADDALAYVADRSRGEVQDASLRLVRTYIATRSREGDCSFFHTSVRDYVYARLDGARRLDLHRRADKWYERQGQRGEAQYHRRQAKQAD